MKQAMASLGFARYAAPIVQTLGDATFAMAKGGGAETGPTKRGKGVKIMAIVQ